MALIIPSGGKFVSNIVHTDYTGLYSNNTATPTLVTGFAATITPSNQANSILVTVSVAFGMGSDCFPYVLLSRNGVFVGSGVNRSTTSQINVFLTGANSNPTNGLYHMKQAERQYLDKPATISPVTYQIYFSSPYLVYGYINRQENQDNTLYIQYPASSITLCEVTG